MQFVENFETSSLPKAFHWFNEPTHFQVGSGLEIVSDAETDFWQNTHYDYQNDDGHCLLTRHRGDFAMSTHVAFCPRERYDQCGLMVRVDAEHWIKVSTEYESEQISRLGSVVTNLGFSDWATQDIPSSTCEMGYRISRNGSDFLLEHSYDGKTWHQLRVSHLHKAPEELEVGVYACSPIGKDFRCRFQSLEISESQWRG
ncbi:MAG: DUF1349 domain-containing protein [Candidatus Latescibacterota bacterium]